MTGLHDLPTELIARIIDHLPLATAKVLITHPVVGAMAKASYHSDLYIELRLSALKTNELDPRTLEIPLVLVEEEINNGLIRPRRVTFAIDEDSCQFFHSNRFAQLSRHLPRIAVTANYLETSGVDLSPVYPLIKDLDILVSSYDASFSSLPSALRHLKMKVFSALPRESEFCTPFFPETLRSIRLEYQISPFLRSGGLPLGLQSLELKYANLVSVEEFNHLHLPLLKRLVLYEMPAITRIDDDLKLPALLVEFEVEGDSLTTFTRLGFPKSLERLKISSRKVTQFSIKAYPCGLNDLSISGFPLGPQGWHSLSTAVGLKTLMIHDCNLDTMDILRVLPRSLEVLLLRKTWIYLCARHVSTKAAETLVGTANPAETLGGTVNPAEAFPWFPSALRSLDITNAFSYCYEHPLPRMMFPQTLTSLILGSFENLTVEELFLQRLLESLHLPALLQTLDLSTCLLYHIPTAFPVGLQSLDLSHNWIDELKGELPPTLKRLNLEETPIKEVDVALPPLLRDLKLGAHCLKRFRIRNAEDPALTLTRLDLLNTKMTTLDGLPHSLTHLHVGGHEVRHPLTLTPPPWLTSLRLYKVNLEGLVGFFFPIGLEELYLEDMGLKTLEGVRLPASLRHLGAPRNRISDVRKIELPPMLETLDLLRNGIRRITGCTFPASLRYFAAPFQEPPMGHFEVDLPERLQRLELQRNQLKEPNLRRIKIPASLKSLHLKDNSIGDYTAFKASYGVGPGVVWDSY